MNPYQNLWGNPKVGNNCKIGAFVDIGKGVEIGDNCIIQAFVSIPPGWKIGNDVFIGPHACFANDRVPKGDWKIQGGEVKDGAWIGMNASIGAGLTIGENAGVGMGSVVLKDIPDGEVWVGNPARRIKRKVKRQKIEGPFEKRPWEDHLSNSV